MSSRAIVGVGTSLSTSGPPYSNNLTAFMRVSLSLPGEFSGQLVEKEMNGGNPAFPGNDEVSSGVSGRLARPALYPLDPTAVAHFLGPCNWLISKVRVSRPERARDAIDFVAAAVNASAGFVEDAILGEDLVNGRAPTLRVVLTEDVVEIAGQQGRYAVSAHSLAPGGVPGRGAS